MNAYIIKMKRRDSPSDCIDVNYKWANNEKDAVKLLLKKPPGKNGICVFKRGGIGELISIEKIENDYEKI